MIIFPILNFVLPLMLTSFLLVNTHVCVECKTNIGLKKGERFESENSQETRLDIDKNKINDDRFIYKQNKANVY